MNALLKAAAALAAACILAACDGGQASGVVVRADNPSIVSHEATDPEMNAAMDRARDRLPYFWEHLASPADGETGFVVKVKFETPGSDPEHMWVSVDGKSEPMTGILENEPYYIKTLTYGQSVTFGQAMISDWGFQRDGLLIGHYTTRVSLDEAPSEEAEAIRAMLGVNPE